jgi:hypothetical protein
VHLGHRRSCSFISISGCLAAAEVLAWLAAVPEVHTMADPAARDYAPFAWRLLSMGNLLDMGNRSAALAVLCKLWRARKDLLEQVSLHQQTAVHH